LQPLVWNGRPSGRHLISDSPFEVDDFDVAVARARALGAPIVLDVHRNPNADHCELWIRDPDGYTVVIASPDGDFGGFASQSADRE